MPYLGLGLHVLVALCFAVHAVRSGQDRYWLMILFMFPLLGSVVYAFAIWLPEQRHTRHGRALVGNVRRMLDPGRELREAQDAYDTSATTDNRMRLADALLAAGRAGEALPMYRAALSGVHRDDPHLQVKLAHALLEAGDAAQARQTLDELIARRADFRSHEGHLTYARAVAALGDKAKAKEEFETLVGYSSGFQAHVRYAECLIGWGELGRARELCEQAQAKAKRLPAYARKMHKPELDQLKELAKRTQTV
ncbi:MULTISPECIES: tetratricopeptide repeat protein [Lysobacter]|uniref:tetratricopeptide repeat protein n=1 Tax=Lysobacter TaxID=68 RepID=UPI001F40CB94|nr:MULTISPECIES: tetratricopeptide repeat protein [Lysobacter]UJB18567.1 tetratricopeptide repeat protein [Lysobacter capsici]UJQ27708.1 tetratricopeptide repeat protein [Lysobacter gummosus]